MVGKFLLGMVSGGLVVTGGLVVFSALFPTQPANDNPAASLEAPIAAPPETSATPSEPAPDGAETPAVALAEKVAPTAPAEDLAEAKTEAPVAAPEAQTEIAEAETASTTTAAAVAESPEAESPVAEAPAADVSVDAPPTVATEADAPEAPVATLAMVDPATSTAAEVTPPETAAEPSKPAETQADTAATAPEAPAALAAEAPAETLLAEVEPPAPAVPDPAPVEAAPGAADPAPAPVAETATTAAADPAASEADPAAPDPAPVKPAPTDTAPVAQPPVAVAVPATEPTPEPAPQSAPEPAPEPAEPVVTAEAAPAAEAPVVEASPSEAPAPMAETPAPDLPQPEPGVTATEDAAPTMPGIRPATLPGAADVPEGARKSSTFKPAPSLPRDGGTAVEDGATEAAPADPAAAPTDPRPIARFAASFENPDTKPPFAIVLIDDGSAGLDRSSLAALPFPVSFALDPLDSSAAQHAATYRAAGKEVVMLVTGIAEGAMASDVEVAFQSMEQGLPEAVAAMDLAEPTFQNRRPLAASVVPILKAQGRGLLTWDAGLNAADQVARREDLEAAVIFRDLGAAGTDPAAVRRLLDRAVFKAGQEGRVAVVGKADPATVAALLEWTVEGKAATVALAPVTAVLKVD